MKILITGAAGYIGSALAQKFENHNLLLIDNYSAHKDGRPHLLNVGKNEIVHADIADEEVCKDITLGIDVIYHLASISGIVNCENIESYRSNIVGTTFLGLWAEKREVKKIIFASTSAVYGESQSIQINESHRIKPRCRYGWEKYICEMILQSLKIPCVIFRMSNVFGEGLYHKQTAVDTFIDKALNDLDIPISGSGEQRRDYVHIDDVVNAYLQALYWDSGIYNIGGNDNLSINELADLIINEANKSYGKNIKKIYNLTADTGRLLKRFNYDYSKAKSFGYNPKGKIIDEVKKRLGGNSNQSLSP